MPEVKRIQADQLVYDIKWYNDSKAYRALFKTCKFNYNMVWLQHMCNYKQFQKQWQTIRIMINL